MLTLPHNLAQINPDEEIVLLDYNSQDGLEDWVISEFESPILSGSLTYVRERSAGRFHMSKAKNIAHRMASGNFVCNLDADSYVDGLSEKILDVCAFGKVLHAWNGPPDWSGRGRISLPRALFYTLGGYDESFQPLMYQDVDLLNRAEALGVAREVVGGWPVNLKNPWPKTRLARSRLNRKQMNFENEAISRRNLSAGKYAANMCGWGAAIVSVNFGEFLSLPPLFPPADNREDR